MLLAAVLNSRAAPREIAAIKPIHVLVTRAYVLVTRRKHAKQTVALSLPHLPSQLQNRHAPVKYANAKYVAANAIAMPVTAQSAHAAHATAAARALAAESSTLGRLCGD